MKKTRILLEFNEKAYQDLIQKQDAAAEALKALVKYCQDVLQIEVTDLKAFFDNPKQYCIDAYWDKFGEQFKNSPVQKDKVFTLTAWSDTNAASYINAAKTAFSFIGPQNFEITENEVTFTRDPEAFKKYVREEDEALYSQLTEFIAMAKDLEAKGGRPVFTLATFHPALAAPGEDLIHSKSYFSTEEKFRNRGIGKFFS